MRLEKIRQEEETRRRQIFERERLAAETAKLKSERERLTREECEKQMENEREARRRREEKEKRKLETFKTIVKIAQPVIERLTRRKN